MCDPKSDYALNKMASDAIVYIDSTGTVVRLTPEDFSSVEEFQRWKGWSDENYHMTEKEGEVFYYHKVSLSTLLEQAIAIKSPEEILVDLQEDLERQELSHLLMVGMDSCLTPIQRRRLWLHKAPLNSQTETQRRKNGTSKRYVSYYCSTHGKSGRSVCSWHRIYEQTLTQIVTTKIKAHAHAVALDEGAVIDRLKRNIAHYDEQRLADSKQEISKLRRRVQELENMTAKLYEDKYAGVVSESTFMVLAQKTNRSGLPR